MSLFNLNNLPNIPRVMRDEDRWVLWQNQDGVKVPMQARKSGALVRARSNDPTTWSSLADAVSTIKTVGKTTSLGLGFMLGDGWVGGGRVQYLPAAGRGEVTNCRPRGKYQPVSVILSATGRKIDIPS